MPTRTPPFPIVRESANWLVINKPSGLAVERNPWEPSVESLMQVYLRGQMEYEPFLGIVHRLDKVTSGLLLLAKRKRILPKLNKQFEVGSISKEYRAWVVGEMPEKEGQLIHYHRRSEDRKKAIVSHHEVKGSKQAVLDYKVLNVVEGKSLLTISPKTGRFHQIRVQLAQASHPILGDDWYNGREGRPEAIALQASSLSFNEPRSDGERITLQLDLPEEWTDRGWP